MAPSGVRYTLKVNQYSNSTVNTTPSPSSGTPALMSTHKSKLSLNAAREDERRFSFVAATG